MSVHSPLAVRVYDDHAPTTLVHQLSALCDGSHRNAALLTANEKTVLFLALAGQSIALVDSHRHGDHGAKILLGRQRFLDQFVGACQKVLDLNDCDNAFLSRPGLLSLLQQSEGNTLAATEFIRLLEVPGSITAKQFTGTRENTQILGSNSRV